MTENMVVHRKKLEFPTNGIRILGSEYKPVDKEKLAAGVVLFGGPYLDIEEKDYSGIDVLLGQRRNMPYQGLLAFPMGKKEDDNDKLFGHFGLRTLLSERAMTELCEEVSPDMSREILRANGVKLFGKPFAIYDGNTGFTIQLSPKYCSNLGAEEYNHLVNGRSDLEKPRFHRVGDIRLLDRRGMLAPIVSPAVGYALKSLSNRRNIEMSNIGIGLYDGPKYRVEG